jgi:hypothetical protein
MSTSVLPEYPVYVISKGRANNGYTANFLLRDRVDFKLVIEPQEEEAYAAVYGKERLYILPFSNLGQGSIPARNWVKEHSTKMGDKRHWILDDNIRNIQRFWRGKRIQCEAGIAFKAIEDFTERYENIAMSGMNYSMFAVTGSNNTSKIPPFYLNCHLYSNFLILNSIPHKWRGRYNEDTDLCLQVLADKWCIISLNVFLINKIATMTVKGGNMETLYKGNGRLKMSRALERLWPGIVTTTRKFKRPQHNVLDGWRRFDTQLKLKEGIVIDKKPNEYGMKICKVKEIKSESLKKFLTDNGQKV